MLNRGVARFVLIAVMACFGAGASGSLPAAAQSRTPMTEPEPLVRETLRQRPRARIRVQPRYPYRTFHTDYPLPYAVEYPGPGAKRQCISRLVTEHRLSGTVIVPRMRCWWVRG